MFKKQRKPKPKIILDPELPNENSSDEQPHIIITKESKLKRKPPRLTQHANPNEQICFQEDSSSEKDADGAMNEDERVLMQPPLLPVIPNA